MSGRSGVWSNAPVEDISPFEVRWYYSAAASSATSVLDLPAKSDFKKFCDGDSLALEACYRKDPQAYEAAWGRLHEEALTAAKQGKDAGQKQQSPPPPQTMQAGLEPAGPVVRGGYYEANLMQRNTYPIYWLDLPQYLLRGTWFIEPAGQRKSPVPLPHGVSAVLEKAFRQRCFDPTMSSEHKLQPEGVYAARVPVNNLLSENCYALMCSRDEMYLCSSENMAFLKRWFGDGQPGARLRRGYRPAQPGTPHTSTAEEDLEAFEGRAAGRAVRHVVLCVHGIGQRMQGASVANDAAEVRNRVNSMLDSQLRGEVGGGYIQALPVQWRKHLTLEADEVSEAIMPEGAKGFRQLAHNTCVEVLMYLSPAHAQYIIDSVATNLNSTYLRFICRHPSFSGKVSILAYSLGSILCYDLLAHQPVPSDALVPRGLEAAEAARTEAARRREQQEEDEASALSRTFSQGSASAAHDRLEFAGQNASTSGVAPDPGPDPADESERGGEGSGGGEGDAVGDAIDAAAASMWKGEGCSAAKDGSGDRDSDSDSADLIKRLAVERDAASQNEAGADGSSPSSKSGKRSGWSFGFRLPFRLWGKSNDGEGSKDAASAADASQAGEEGASKTPADSADGDDIDAESQSGATPEVASPVAEADRAQWESLSASEKVAVIDRITRADPEEEQGSEAERDASMEEAAQRPMVAGPPRTQDDDQSYPARYEEVMHSSDGPAHDAMAPGKGRVPSEGQPLTQRIDDAARGKPGLTPATNQATQGSSSGVALAEQTVSANEEASAAGSERDGSTLAQRILGSGGGASGTQKETDAKPARSRSGAAGGQADNNEAREVSSKPVDFAESYSASGELDRSELEWLRDEHKSARSEVLRLRATLAEKELSRSLSGDHSEGLRHRQDAAAATNAGKDCPAMQQSGGGQEQQTSERRRKAKARSQSLRKPLNHMPMIQEGSASEGSFSEGDRRVNTESRDMCDAALALLSGAESAEHGASLPDPRLLPHANGAAVAGGASSARASTSSNTAGAQVGAGSGGRADSCDGSDYSSEGCEAEEEEPRAQAPVDIAKAFVSKEGRVPAVPGATEAARIALARKLWPGAALRSLEKGPPAPIKSRELRYPKLCFEVDNFFMIGSPTGIFCALRGISPNSGVPLGSPAAAQLYHASAPCALPICRRFYNIFHPFDPVAYRLEPLVNMSYASKRPELVPYHRGGKKLHIGLAEAGGSLARGFTLNFKRGVSASGSADQSASGAVPEQQTFIQHLLGVPVEASYSDCGSNGRGPSSSGRVGPSDAAGNKPAAEPAIVGFRLERKEHQQLARLLPDLMDESHMNTDASIFARRPSRRLKTSQSTDSVLEPGTSSAQASVVAADTKLTRSTSLRTRSSSSMPPVLNYWGAPVAAIARSGVTNRVGSSCGRLDFQLQEDMLETQFFGAFTAHFCYWKHDDLALFISRAVCGYDVVDGLRLPGYECTAADSETERRAHLLDAGTLDDSVIQDLLQI